MRMRNNILKSMKNVTHSGNCRQCPAQNPKNQSSVNNFDSTNVWCSSQLPAHSLQMVSYCTGFFTDYLQYTISTKIVSV